VEKKMKKNSMKNVNWQIVKMLEKRALDVNPKKHFDPNKYCKELDSKMSQLRSTRNCKYMANYHYVWCPRGRVKILFHEARELLREAIWGICKIKGWIPFAIEPMPDHVHLFISAKDDREKVMGILKGSTSSFLRSCFPIFNNALTAGGIWSRSYYMGTIGNISGKTLLEYLARQWKETDAFRYMQVMHGIDGKQMKLFSY
jgi:putative transposase